MKTMIYVLAAVFALGVFQSAAMEKCRVYGEFARHTDIFLSVEPAPAVSGAPADVLTRTWRCNGEDWLLVINTLEKTVDCKLKVDGHGELSYKLAPLDVVMERVK